MIAAFYAGLLNSNLLLLQSIVQAISTRILIQNALQRYNAGNITEENWLNTQRDIDSAIGGKGTPALALQARVVSKNGTGTLGPYGLVNVTATSIMGKIVLPVADANGNSVYLGDGEQGYPPTLYPNLTFTSTVVNSTFNESAAFLNGNQLPLDTSLFLGPVPVNESFALISITTAIINNTSATDVLGWITVVLDAHLIVDVERSTAGLGRTGEILLVGPTTLDNKFPGALKTGPARLNRTAAKNQEVRFVLPPVRNPSRSNRHPSRSDGSHNTPFEARRYPSVLYAFSEDNAEIQNAGSLISTTNEENKQVSAGFGLTLSPMVDWVVLVEQSHAEVTAPIGHLRNVLIACVFGTTGVLLLLVFPIAHLSVRPIRRLREATKKTVEPYRYSSENGSLRSSISGDDEARRSGEEETAAMAKKEGFLGRLSDWRNARFKGRAEHEEQREHRRRRSFRIPGKVQDRKHLIQDELTELTTTFNEMSEELVMQYERLEERVRERTQELELSKKAAEAANESKTLFIANISHELKTPLNGILGMTAVCMQEEDQSKIKRSLGIIYKSGDLLLHLLTDLLTFSKNQFGQQLALEEKEFRLADISSQILSIFEKQAREGSIKLNVVFQGTNDGLDGSLDPLTQDGFGPCGTGRVRDMFLWGDQHRILQVVINLVSNSLKFTPPHGSVDVRIRCMGEAEKSEKAESRIGSILSKHSYQTSKKSRRRRRVTSRSRSSVSPAPGDHEKTRYSETGPRANAAEPKIIPNFAMWERSSSPPPANARVLMFEFEVEDTGPGIPESQQQRVFEPFVQGDLGLSKKYGGTGLGLSICSQLADLMKGSIMLKSEEGVGSKFTMRIPMIFIKERADSTTSSKLNSRHNSLKINGLKNESQTPLNNKSSADVSLHSVNDGLALDGFDTPSKPRLVGLSQPFFAAPSPLESSAKRLAAIERVAVQASQGAGKMRILVAEDNKVNQEVVLRMLKLEDIYGKNVFRYRFSVLIVYRRYRRQQRPRSF